MDAYDSDSSIEDADNGTSTNVLLGYASEEPTDDVFSQLGGEPSWLEPSNHPSPALVQCKVCNSLMSLLLQLNGDLPDRYPEHERRLYVWACRRKACRRKPGSIRIIRAVKGPKTSSIPASQGNTRAGSNTVKEPFVTNIGGSLFGAQHNSASVSNPFSSTSTSNPFSTIPNSNPFSATPNSNPFSSTPASNPFAPQNPTIATDPSPQQSIDSSNAIDTLPATFAAKASITTTPQARATAPAPQPAQASPPSPPPPWPPQTQFPTPYPSYNLDAEYEYLATSPATTTHSKSAHYDALMDVDSGSSSSTRAKGSGSGSGSGSADQNNEKEDAQLYESEHDRAFQHFADILSSNPDQVLRYEFGGSPLLYSRTDAVGRIFAPSTSTPPQSGNNNSNSKITTTGPASATIPKCSRCGASRLFEMQLMPHAIAELEADEGPEDVARLLDEGMEWGTIVVAVCGRDCVGGDGGLEYLEEWVGVQWEETVVRGSGKGIRGAR